MLRILTGSEYHLDCSASDGRRRGRSSATDSLLLYLHTVLIVFHASHELQALVFFFPSDSNSDSILAKRARSPKSSFSALAFDPSIGSCTWNWTYEPVASAS
jgi:hypothetical protein